MRALSALVILRDGVAHLIASNGMCYQHDNLPNVNTGDDVWLYVSSDNMLTGVQHKHDIDEPSDEPYERPFLYDMDHSDDIYHLSDDDNDNDNDN